MTTTIYQFNELTVNDHIIAEREQCCRDVCRYCADPEAFKLGPAICSEGNWHHVNKFGTGVFCCATAIRERAAK